MRAVLQRVTKGKVTVEDRVTGEIGYGLVILLGVGANDTEAEVDLMANKIANLRIFVYGKVHFAPRAVMKAAYSGVQQSPAGTETAGTAVYGVRGRTTKQAHARQEASAA